MKKIMATLLSAAVIASLCACDASKETDKSDSTGTMSYATLGDIFATGDGSEQAQWSNTKYVCVFYDGDRPMRAEADITPEVSAAVDAIDMMAVENYSDEVENAVSGLPVTKLEDLSGYKISDDDLGSFSGQTGQALLDRGLEGPTAIYEGTSDVTVIDQYFSYEVTLEVTPDENIEDEEAAADYFANATIGSVTFDGFCYRATDFDE